MHSFGASSGPAGDARLSILSRVNQVTSALRIGEQSESLQALPPIFLQSCETKSGMESLGSRLTLTSYTAGVQTG